MGEAARSAEDLPEKNSAERLKFFTDAVVAIALTLLVLPLMESASNAAEEGLSTAEYLHRHNGQLLSFALSFLIVATFWMMHHRLYEDVAKYSPRLVWLNIAWMAVIIWMPVPTALVGAATADALQKVLYIGTMVTGALLTALSYGYLRRHTELLLPGTTRADLGGGFAAAIALTALFLVALLVALLIPAVGYFAMLVMSLTSAVQSVLAKRIGALDRGRDEQGRTAEG